MLPDRYTDGSRGWESELQDSGASYIAKWTCRSRRDCNENGVPNSGPKQDQSSHMGSN